MAKRKTSNRRKVAVPKWREKYSRLVSQARKAKDEGDDEKATKLFRMAERAFGKNWD